MKMIQVRNVPDDVHRTLKIRAAEQGLSLSDYLLGEIERFARQPTLEEVIAAIKRDGPVELPEDSATSVRAIRDAG
jgi:plasmid stability protein